MNRVRRSGPPIGGAAPELIESRFALENADAPFLHQGLIFADMAHGVVRTGGSASLGHRPG
jgi:argininosuccinate lyase